jgi:hypothetical protein
MCALVDPSSCSSTMSWVLRYPSVSVNLVFAIALIGSPKRQLVLYDTMEISWADASP